MKIVIKLLVLILLVLCGSILVVVFVGKDNKSDKSADAVKLELPVNTEVSSKITDSSASRLKCEIENIGSEYSLVDVQFLDDNIGFVVSSGGELLKTLDGGKTWKEKEVPISAKGYLKGMSFINPQTGWVIVNERSSYGEDAERNSNRGTILLARDGGKTWEKQIDQKGINFEKVSFFDDQHGWAIGFKANSQREIDNYEGFNSPLILYTNNSGKRWDDISDVLSNYEHGVAIDILPKNADEALLLADKRIYQLSAKEKKVGLVKDFTDRPQTHIKQFGVLQSGAYWLLGGTDSKEGLWGVLGISRDDGWKVYRVRSNFKRAIFLSQNEVVASAYAISVFPHTWGIPSEKFLSRNSGKLLLFSKDGGENWETLCINKTFGSIEDFSLAGDKLWAVGWRTVLKLSR